MKTGPLINNPLWSQGLRIVWGYMLENTVFVEFEIHNQAFIEEEYINCKIRTSEAYVEIEDLNLPRPHEARIYIGVLNNHLRMPGTRYHVYRLEFKQSTPYPLATAAIFDTVTTRNRTHYSTPVAMKSNPTATTTVNYSKNHNQDSRAIFNTNQTRKRNAPSARTQRKIRKASASNKTPRRRPNKNTMSKEERTIENNVEETPMTAPLSSPATYMSTSFVSSPTSSMSSVSTITFTGSTTLNSNAGATGSTVNSLPIITHPKLVAIISSNPLDDGSFPKNNTGFVPYTNAAIYSPLSMPNAQQMHGIHAPIPTSNITVTYQQSALISELDSYDSSNSTEQVMGTSQCSHSQQGQQQWSTSVTPYNLTTYYNTTKPAVTMAVKSNGNHFNTSNSSLSNKSSNITATSPFINAENNNTHLPQIQQMYNPSLHDRELYHFLFNNYWDNNSNISSANSINNNNNNNAAVSWSSYVPISF
ncbi:hypothetical protein BDF20DRAFT_909533 [Mycotypha africana]|uniref:uncharacterized protein n=1 Tax=Mycotypha africana TaxID=64632 RepID=UPI0022FFCF6C|nr:uncharacterized protein BDF20DRAFT_909533 [Mycotypha africana]KAI8991805.1 hypothetical protein BDF20DRAFT_909533 [Mycotypha africana]